MICRLRGHVLRSFLPLMGDEAYVMCERCGYQPKHLSPDGVLRG
jgi:hypothetical protein